MLPDTKVQSLRTLDSDLIAVRYRWVSDRRNQMNQTSASGQQQMKLGVHIVPVSRIERSKQFYERLGWRFDADLAPANGSPRAPGDLH
jgi:hypothetical protein